MTIRIGERIPSAMLSQMGENGPQPFLTSDYFAGRKVVLFSGTRLLRHDAANLTATIKPRNSRKGNQADG